MIFVPPSGPFPARIAIVGECPGEQEELRGTPFIGASGMELDRLLHEAGILRSECYVTNTLKFRPPDNDLDAFVCRKKHPPASNWVDVDGIWFHPEVVDQLDLVRRELRECKADVVFALGNLALWLTTGRWGITDWRGSTIRTDYGVVVPTYHPAAIFRQWSWRPYIGRDFARGAAVARRGLVVPNYTYIINPQLGQVHACYRDLLDRLESGPTILSCDIETRRGQIDCIGVAWSRTEALCIPFWSRARANYWNEDEETAIIIALRAVLCHPNARVIGQNFAYDVQYIFRQWGFYPRLALDTMVTHHVVWPGTDKDLATLSSLYCDYHRFWKHESQEADEREDDLGRWGYNAEDCVRTFEIAEALSELVIAEGLAEQCKFQHQMWWHAVGAMRRGVRTDAATKKDLSRLLFAEISNREDWVRGILGHDLNIRSPKQLSALFYDDLRCAPVKVRTPQGPRVSTNEEALLQIAVDQPLARPLIRRVLEIRSLGVFRSTFVESKLDKDGRIRCSYNVAGTDTFRFSSSQNAFGSGMNLQNVPKGNEDDVGADDFPLILPNIRKLFLPDSGMELFDMDLSSADLRIVVWESDERELKQMLAAGLDPYTEIAREFYNDRSITKRDPRRQLFKSFAHGTNYLGSARGLAKRLGLPVAKAERTQAWYLRRFPRIGEWQSRLKTSCVEQRLVSNRFGYRRYFFDRIDDQVFRRAAAWIPQSTVGLLINKIWDRLEHELPGVEILLQVHDSLVGQYPAAQSEHFRSRLNHLSRIVIPYTDPLVIPTGLKVSTKSWGDVSDEALR